MWNDVKLFLQFLIPSEVSDKVGGHLRSRDHSYYKSITLHDAHSPYASAEAWTPLSNDAADRVVQMDEDVPSRQVFGEDM